jgi:hypothetical protein
MNIEEKATDSKFEVSITLALISRSCDIAGKDIIIENSSAKIICTQRWFTC